MCTNKSCVLLWFQQHSLYNHITFGSQSISLSIQGYKIDIGVMESPFNVTAWQPTKPPEPGDSERSDSEIATLIQKLNEQTEVILKHPYDPNNWILRAKTLTKLRYPELAVGDAHKATLLCRSHLAYLLDKANGGWRLGNRMGFWMKDSQPRDDADREILRQYLARLQKRAHYTSVGNMYFYPSHEEGRFRRRMYPWMIERHRKRSDELLEKLNEEFACNPADSPKGEPNCIVKRHAFEDSANEIDTSDLLGVFAAHDVDDGETVLIDIARTWGCNGPGTDGDYENLRGGKGCSDPIHPNEDSDDTDLDLRWIRDGASKQSSTVLVNVRLLLCSIQDGFKHPLDHPLIARLTPTYREDKIDGFSLHSDIGIPNEALQRFGVDVFANHNYDTWVLFTIQARVNNNSCGDPMAESLNPLFALFNHSCEGNVHWGIREDHRTIMVKAKRDIKEGEQLLVEYDQFMEDQPLEIRRKRMRRWLDGPCQCTRCVREEEDQKQAGGKARRDSKVDWDDMPEVLFPEDLLKLKN